MKIIQISNSIKLSNVRCSDNIHLFTQFFIPSNLHRLNELKQCLNHNVNNPEIYKIHILTEKMYDLGISSNKIIQTVIGKRLMFKDVLEYIRKYKITGYQIMLNADICFSETALLNLRRSPIHLQKQMYALLRYEYDVNEPNSSHIFGPRFDSQDTWILHSNFSIFPKAESLFDFEFGRPGCDNKLLYLMNVLGYEILNDPKCIQTYHIHSSKSRSYSSNDSLKLPCGVIVPYGFKPLQMKYHLGIQINDVYNTTRGFKEIMYHDNQTLYDYIQMKNAKNEHFILPRISGIENNVAVFARIIRDESHTDLVPLYKYIRNILPIMKNNAGILLKTETETEHYSNLYLSAFEKCEILAGWDIQGNYIGHIAQSHAYLRNIFPTKRMIWALTFDIFHYIYNTPWTHALKGKRVLIISPFESSILKQIPIRAHLYDDIDLFPDCEIITLKPPQTQGGEHSRGFTIEFEDFKKSVERMIDTFDIALVSCGGYANPICSFIYEKGKSAIYVGGVLQMYFGIYGSRWLKERPEIIQLFSNKHWTRPDVNERPKNNDTIEDGCYW